MASLLFLLPPNYSHFMIVEHSAFDSTLVSFSLPRPPHVDLVGTIEFQINGEKLSRCLCVQTLERSRNIGGGVVVAKFDVLLLKT